MLLFGMGGAAAVHSAGAAQPLWWRSWRDDFLMPRAPRRYRRASQHNAYFNLGYGLCGTVAIVALMQAERARPARFDDRTLQLLGDASYAIYLIHFPLIAVLCKAAVALGLHGFTGAIVAFIGIFICCVLASVLFYLWVERPMLRALRVLSARGPAKPAQAQRASTV